MRKLLGIVFVGLISAAIVACGGDPAEPTSTTLPAVATQAPTAAPDRPTLAPTATAAPANTPTTMPAQANTPTPTVAPTDVPEPTATPAPVPTETPTATPALQPTATPEPTAEPEPTATPVPTATPAPEAETSENPVLAELLPLGDNLLWAAHYDNATGQWSVYDPSGTFSAEMLPLPPGQTAEDITSFSSITRLVPGQIYSLMVKEDQTAVLGGISRTLRGDAINLLSW